MDYEISITIPKKQYKKIWKKYFPNSKKILSEYFFMLHDTYGLSLYTIENIYIKIINLQNKGNKIILPNPYCEEKK